MDFCDVIIKGRIVQEPTLTHINGGQPLCQFTVAVNRWRRMNSGKREQHDADFIDCKAWHGIALSVERLSTVGSNVIVKGTMKTKRYKTDGGEFVTKVWIHVIHFDALDKVVEVDEKGEEVKDGGQDGELDERFS